MANRFNSLLIKKAPKSEPYGFYQYAAALFFYQEHNNYRKITQSIKYKGNVAAGKYFGQILGKKLSESWGKDVDLVIPIPLHWTRKLSRGYNQAAIVACGIASVLNVKMLPDGLCRIRRTKTQTKVSTENKEKNVEGAFRTNPRRLNMLKACKHIIIVDDVFTTGSTISSAYFALRETVGKKVRISAVTLGCVQQ